MPPINKNLISDNVRILSSSLRIRKAIIKEKVSLSFSNKDCTIDLNSIRVKVLLILFTRSARPDGVLAIDFSNMEIYDSKENW